MDGYGDIPRTPGVRNNLRSLLFSIAIQLDSEDVRRLIFLSSDVINSKQQKERIHSAFNFFEILMERDALNEDNINVLLDLLSKIRRFDLKKEAQKRWDRNRQRTNDHSSGNETAKPFPSYTQGSSRSVPGIPVTNPDGSNVQRQRNHFESIYGNRRWSPNYAYPSYIHRLDWNSKEVRELLAEPFRKRAYAMSRSPLSRSTFASHYRREVLTQSIATEGEIPKAYFCEKADSKLASLIAETIIEEDCADVSRNLLPEQNSSAFHSKTGVGTDDEDSRMLNQNAPEDCLTSESHLLQSLKSNYSADNNENFILCSEITVESSVETKASNTIHTLRSDNTRTENNHALGHEKLSNNPSDPQENVSSYLTGSCSLSENNDTGQVASQTYVCTECVPVSSAESEGSLTIHTLHCENPSSGVTSALSQNERDVSAPIDSCEVEIKTLPQEEPRNSTTCKQLSEYHYPEYEECDNFLIDSSVCTELVPASSGDMEGSATIHTLRSDVTCTESSPERGNHDNTVDNAHGENQDMSFQFIPEDMADDPTISMVFEKSSQGNNAESESEICTDNRESFCTSSEVHSTSEILTHCVGADVNDKLVNDVMTGSQCPSSKPYPNDGMDIPTSRFTDEEKGDTRPATGVQNCRLGRKQDFRDDIFYSANHVPYAFADAWMDDKVRNRSASCSRRWKNMSLWQLYTSSSKPADVAPEDVPIGEAHVDKPLRKETLDEHPVNDVSPTNMSVDFKPSQTMGAIDKGQTKETMALGDSQNECQFPFTSEMNECGKIDVQGSVLGVTIRRGSKRSMKKKSHQDESIKHLQRSCDEKDTTDFRYENVLLVPETESILDTFQKDSLLHCGTSGSYRYLEKTVKANKEISKDAEKDGCRDKNNGKEFKMPYNAYSRPYVFGEY